MGTRRADRVEQNYLLFESRESKSAKKALQRQIRPNETRDRGLPIPKCIRIQDCDQVIILWSNIFWEPTHATIANTDP